MRNITKDAQEDAKRLKRLWIEKKDELHLSQARAAKEMGYTTQAAVSQYLNGRVALNFEAAAKFAKILRVELSEIAPRFAPLVSKMSPSELEGYVAPLTAPLAGETKDEVLNWFAYSPDFLHAIDSDHEKIRLIKLDNPDCDFLQPGSVVLARSFTESTPTAGTYLIRTNGNLVARRLRIEGDNLIMTSHEGSEKTLTVDLFSLLRVVGKVVLQLKEIE